MAIAELDAKKRMEEAVKAESIAAKNDADMWRERAELAEKSLARQTKVRPVSAIANRMMIGFVVKANAAT
eukprot:1473031-Rhodomonas_salina.1